MVFPYTDSVILSSWITLILFSRLHQWNTDPNTSYKHCDMAHAKLSASRAQTGGIREFTPLSFPASWNYMLSLKDKHLHLLTLSPKCVCWTYTELSGNLKPSERQEGGLRQWRQWSPFCPHGADTRSVAQLPDRSQVVTCWPRACFSHKPWSQTGLVTALGMNRIQAIFIPINIPVGIPTWKCKGSLVSQGCSARAEYKPCR